MFLHLTQDTAKTSPQNQAALQILLRVIHGDGDGNPGHLHFHFPDTISSTDGQRRFRTTRIRQFIFMDGR